LGKGTRLRDYRFLFIEQFGHFVIWQFHMRSFLDNFWAVYELARLYVITGGKLKGAYWTWRWQTALGENHGKSRWELARAALEYGRWVARMRRAAR
jgi:hypothetical protein